VAHTAPPARLMPRSPLAEGLGRPVAAPRCLRGYCLSSVECDAQSWDSEASRALSQFRFRRNYVQGEVGATCVHPGELVRVPRALCASSFLSPKNPATRSQMSCAIATDSSTLMINLMMLIGCAEAVPDRAAVRAMRAVRTPCIVFIACSSRAGSPGRACSCVRRSRTLIRRGSRRAQRSHRQGS
jgi:hypothetical protein